MPNSLDGRDQLGVLSFASSAMPQEQPPGLPVAAGGVDNQPQAMASGMRQIGKWGNGSLEFWCPSGVTMTRNNEFLIVVDSWNHRLQVRDLHHSSFRSSEKDDFPLLGLDNRWSFHSFDGRHERTWIERTEQSSRCLSEYEQ